ALLAHRLGARVVALSDASGGVARPGGLDIPALVAEYAGWRRPLKEYSGEGVTHLSQEEVLTAEADVLVPAALGEVLTPEIAGDVRARFIVEGANAPTLPGADEI